LRLFFFGNWNVSFLCAEKEPSDSVASNYFARPFSLYKWKVSLFPPPFFNWAFFNCCSVAPSRSYETISPSCHVTSTVPGSPLLLLLPVFQSPLCYRGKSLGGPRFSDTSFLFLLDPVCVHIFCTVCANLVFVFPVFFFNLGLVPPGADFHTVHRVWLFRQFIPPCSLDPGFSPSALMCGSPAPPLWYFFNFPGAGPTFCAHPLQLV